MGAGVGTGAGDASCGIGDTSRRDGGVGAAAGRAAGLSAGTTPFFKASSRAETRSARASVSLERLSSHRRSRHSSASVRWRMLRGRAAAVRWMVSVI